MSTSTTTHQSGNYAGPVLNPQPLASTLSAAELSAALLESTAALPAPAALERTTQLAAMLHEVNLATLHDDPARYAFWVNIYNALVRHAFCVLGIRGSVVRNLGVFDRAAWVIARERYSLNIIEHGLLRGNARSAPLHLFRTVRPSDPRLATAPTQRDCRIHFALNCGARSCPPVRLYSAALLEEQFAAATRDYFAVHAQLDRARCQVTLPRLMQYFRRDFGTRAQALTFAALYLDAAASDWLTLHAEQVKIGYGSYDWTIVGPSG